MSFDVGAHKKIIALALDDASTDQDLAEIMAATNPSWVTLRKLEEEIKRAEKAKSRIKKIMNNPPQMFLIGGDQLLDLLIACPEDHIIGECRCCGYRGRIKKPLCNKCGEVASFLIVSPTDNVRKFVYGV
jgi:hypothetical protein